MEFNKYRDKGDYHWKEFAKKSIYRKHVLKVLDWVKEDIVLDVGAGDGLITYQLGLLGKQVIGIENDAYALAIAKEKGVPVEFGDAYAPFFDEPFPAIFMGDVIEHLEFPSQSILALKKLIIPGSKLYVVTPPKKKEGKRDKYHYKEYSPKELTEFIEAFGFKTESIEVIPEFCRMYAKFS